MKTLSVSLPLIFFLTLLCSDTSYSYQDDESIEKKYSEQLVKEFQSPKEQFPFLDSPSPTFEDCQMNLTSLFLWSMMEGGTETVATEDYPDPNKLLRSMKGDEGYSLLGQHRKIDISENKPDSAEKTWTIQIETKQFKVKFDAKLASDPAMIQSVQCNGKWYQKNKTSKKWVPVADDK